VKEQAGLLRSDGKRLDRATLIPSNTLGQGEIEGLFVTAPDTIAKSHLSSTAAEQEAAADQTADNKDCTVSGT